VFGATSTVAPLSSASDTAGQPPVRSRRRATLMRDIGIGVGCAAFLFGVFAIVKVFLFQGDDAGKAPKSVPKGTITVTVTGNEPADVFVDDSNRGTVRSDKPLQLQVELGEHNIRVNRDSAKAPCKRDIEVLDVNVEKQVECVLEPKKSPVGSLVLEGFKDEYDVFVDGVKIADDSKGEPLELAAGKTHEVVIKAADKTVSEFSVTVEAGKEERRTIVVPEESGAKDEGTNEPKPDKPDKPKKPEDTTPKPDGYLRATTKPYAKVFVDGKDTGRVTPISPRRRIPLKPGRHKVTFVTSDGKKHTSWVKIKSEQTTTLDKDLQ
jgi:hypothetical protein